MGNINSIAPCSPYLGGAVGRWLLTRVFEPLIANKGAQKLKQLKQDTHSGASKGYSGTMRFIQCMKSYRIFFISYHKS